MFGIGVKEFKIKMSKIKGEYILLLTYGYAICFCLCIFHYPGILAIHRSSSAAATHDVDISTKHVEEQCIQKCPDQVSIKKNKISGTSEGHIPFF